MDDKTIENKIDEIHDMLIDYMNEDAASPILEKIRMFVEKVRSDGYHDGCNDSQKAFFRLATPQHVNGNKTMKFTLAIEFVDGNHTTTDRWKSISKDDVLKAIVDHLDILHRDWVPYEPDFDRIRTNFIKFNPYDAEKYAQSEYKRCLDGYVAYQRVYRDLSMLSEIEPDNVSPLTYEVDKQTTILVVVE